jgi:hypothetical protein
MSTTTIDLDEKTYGQLLRRTLPHVIHTGEECERLTKELIRLDERGRNGKAPPRTSSFASYKPVCGL